MANDLDLIDWIVLDVFREGRRRNIKVCYKQGAAAAGCSITTIGKIKRRLIAQGRLTEPPPKPARKAPDPILSLQARNKVKMLRRLKQRNESLTADA